MPVTNTDAVLHYNVGVFGEAGYAVPNWSNDHATLNPTIWDWVTMVGRNLQNFMEHEDADLRTPPSRNTLERVHKLYLRGAQILAGRAVPSGERNREVLHVSPAGEVFLVFPTPYFKVRNPFMRRWCGYILMSLAEAMQHTENRKEVEISTQFAGLVGQYLKWVYENMAIELFMKTREEAKADGFLLTAADFDAYKPEDFFTSTELSDTVPRLDRVFTEDARGLLTEGIPITHLPPLGPWPVNLTDHYAGTRTDATIYSGGGTTTTSGGTTTTAAPIIPPAPAP